MPSTVSQSSSVILNSRLSRSTPALLTSTAGGPSSAATLATAALTCSASLTSAPTARAAPPAAVIASTVAPQSPSFRSSTATASPSAASRRAVPAPMPARRAGDDGDPRRSRRALLRSFGHVLLLVVLLSSSRYLCSSRRASERLCTSSGPSANRSVRALAHRWASGKSWLMPPAPWAWMALSITHWAIRGVAILMAWISVCAPLLPTVSISQAVLSTSSRADSIRTRDSAIQSWMTPCSASGLPNAVRSVTRRHISSRARSAAPICRMQWWIRPGPSRAWAIANPSPSPAIRFSAGTRTSVNTTSAWPPCVPSE